MIMSSTQREKEENGQLYEKPKTTEQRKVVISYQNPTLNKKVKNIRRKSFLKESGEFGEFYQ